MPMTDDELPEDYDALKAAFIEMRAKVFGAEALIEHLQLVIAKMKREIYGPRSERSQRLLDQLELQLEDMIAASGRGKGRSGAGQSGARPSAAADDAAEFPRSSAPPAHRASRADLLPVLRRRASSRRSARTSPRRSTWCRGKCSLPSMCVRSSAAGPARRSASRRLHSTRSPVASQARACWQ